MATSGSIPRMITIKLQSGNKVTVQVEEEVYERLNSNDSSVKTQATKELIEFATAADCECDVAKDENNNASDPTTDTVKSTDTFDESAFVWNDESKKALFNLRSDMETDFLKAKNHGKLWSSIRDSLAAMGCMATSTQCQNKWKNMKKEFMKTMDHNNKTGETPKRCHFFDEFSELYGCKASTKPEFTLASSSSNSSSPVKMNKNRKRKLVESPTLAFLKEYSQKQEEATTKRAEEGKKRHDEKMGVMERFLDVFGKIVDQKK